MAAAPALAALASNTSNLGLRSGQVKLVEHDANWAALYNNLALAISEALNNDHAQVAHIGSTSIPGLAAKPVLDVAVGLPAPIENDDVVARLCDLGFTFVDDLGIYGGLFFTFGRAGDVVTHVHVVDSGDFQWKWYRAFRDGLRADDKLRDEYEALKRAAEVENREDRDGYTKAKFDWVLATVSKLAD